MSSIAPDELAALIKAALLAIGQEDHDPVCIRDALWLAATMNAAEHDPADQAWAGTDILRGRRRANWEPFAAAKERDAGRPAVPEGESRPGTARAVR